MGETSHGRREAGGVRASDDAKTIGLVVIADRSPGSLARLLEGIPEGMRGRISEVFLAGFPPPEPPRALEEGPRESGAPKVVRLSRRRGVGTAQKAAIRLALEHGLDILAVLRGTEAPVAEVLEKLIAPLDRRECAAVIGLRTHTDGGPAGGGVSPGRRMGTAVLGKLDRMLSPQLRDPHSGWRAYEVSALASVPFEGNATDDHFDLQVILQLLAANRHLLEVPLPPLHEEGLSAPETARRVWDTSTDVLRVRLSRLGYLSGHLGSVGSEYGLKREENSSHSVVLRWIGQMPAGRVLDLGCSSGLLSERVRSLGHRVTGVDVSALPGVTDRVDRFLIADLDRGLPPEIGEEGPFDMVIAADVLEHVRDPERLLKQIRRVLVPRGTLIASVPNFAHWYPRIRTAVGLFDYDQRGILDSGHVRFFTRRSLLDLVRRSGFLVTRQQATGLPLEVISTREDVLRRGLRAADRLTVGAWPTLFGYQFVIRCETPDTISSATPAVGSADRHTGSLLRAVGS
jgi:2-polyprenyl-3-methyl-5-hydroxy-6-metoxy-1,4-benzoquinol methylase